MLSSLFCLIYLQTLASILLTLWLHTTKIGRWYEISLISISLKMLEHLSISFVKIWSIMVAVSFVILVGLFISGKKPLLYIKSTYNLVPWFCSHFNNVEIPTKYKQILGGTEHMGNETEHMGNETENMGNIEWNTMRIGVTVSIRCNTWNMKNK